MRTASCGFVIPDGREFPQHLPFVPTPAPVPVCPQAVSTDSPRHLALQPLTSLSAQEGQRNRLGVGPRLMEERG
jgi:hypothetical protein